jgi:hypothetical protein
MRYVGLSATGFNSQTAQTELILIWLLACIGRATLENVLSIHVGDFEGYTQPRRRHQICSRTLAHCLSSGTKALPLMSHCYL